MDKEVQGLCKEMVVWRDFGKVGGGEVGWVKCHPTFGKKAWWTLRDRNVLGFTFRMYDLK